MHKFWLIILVSLSVASTLTAGKPLYFQPGSLKIMFEEDDIQQLVYRYKKQFWQPLLHFDRSHNEYIGKLLIKAEHSQKKICIDMQKIPKLITKIPLSKKNAIPYLGDGTPDLSSIIVICEKD